MNALAVCTSCGFVPISPEGVRQCPDCGGWEWRAKSDGGDRP